MPSPMIARLKSSSTRAAHRTYSWTALLVSALFCGSATGALAQLRALPELEGPYDFAVTGATLRRAPNSVDPCSVYRRGVTTWGSLSGIPAGSTVVKAYLYWAGSGGLDASVNFSGSAYTADSTATGVYNFNGTNYYFFGAMADVTSTVVALGLGATYGVSGLAIDFRDPYCAASAVTGGWGLVVIYANPTLPVKRISVRDGLRILRNQTESVILDGFMAAPVPSARFSTLLYEGDPETTFAGTEALRFNGNVLSDAANPAGNPFNSVSNTGVSPSYGFDLETFSTSAYMTAGDRSASVDVEAGSDLVLLQFVVSSTAVVMVNVTPDGLPIPVQRLPGTGYSQVFQVENTSISSASFDLLTRASGSTPLALVIDSIRGPAGKLSGARADSAQVFLSAGTTTSFSVWYSVPMGDPVLNLDHLLARSVTYPTRPEARDTGYAEIRRIRPVLTLSKSVNPTGTLATGTELTYTMQFANPGDGSAQGVTVVDEVPPQVAFKIGSVTSSLPSGVTATVQYSNDGGSTWAYTPVSAGCGAPAGFDACVNRIRWVLSGALASGTGTGTVGFIARIK